MCCKWIELKIIGVLNVQMCNKFKVTLGVRKGLQKIELLF
jgi:hypothetical protein